MGLSISPRRQAVSQGCAQTRPQILAMGLGSRAIAVGLFKFALGNERNITAGIGMRGTGHHAGEVGVQPIPVNLLVDKAFEHPGTSPY